MVFSHQFLQFLRQFKPILIGDQFKANGATFQLATKHGLRFALDKLHQAPFQDLGKIVAPVEDVLVCVSLGAQGLEHLLNHLRRQVGVGQDVVDAAAEKFDTEFLLHFQPFLIGVVIKLRQICGQIQNCGGFLNFLYGGVIQIQLSGRHLRPVKPAQDIVFIIQQAVTPASAVHHLRQEDLHVAERLASVYRKQLAALAVCPSVGAAAYKFGKVAHAFLLQPEFDIFYRFADIAVIAVDVRLVQGGSAGQFRIRLAQDAAGHLSQGPWRAGGIEQRKHISKRAIPSFPQGVFCQNVTDAGIGRQQVFIGDLVFFRGLPPNVIFRHLQLRHQVVTHIFGMDMLSVALFASDALHADQHDGANVAATLVLQSAGLPL